MTYRPPIYSQAYVTVSVVEDDDAVSVRIAGTAGPFEDVLVIDVDAADALVDLLAGAAEEATALIDAQHGGN